MTYKKKKFTFILRKLFRWELFKLFTKIVINNKNNKSNGV
jgi:hypothetical protein